MAGAPEDDDATPSRAEAWDRSYDAALDEMTVLLREQAKAWAARLRLLLQLDDLSSLGAKAGVAQFPQLEMAGSWHISQITATRWQAEAVRFAEALPQTLAMLETGRLLEHQAKVLLHRTANCTVEVARAVEAQVLPDGAGLCPADLTVRVDRAVLRTESELTGAAAAERRRAQAVAQRRTFGKALPDGMGLAGAVLTAEQLVTWQTGMDALERRERRADRATGVERTAEQRRADLFAALPSMVLAGTAQDRAAVSAVLAAVTGAGETTGAPMTRPAQPAAADDDCGPATTASGATTSGRYQSPSAATCSRGSVGAPRTPCDADPGDSGRALQGPAAPPVVPPVEGLRPWTLGPEELAAHVILDVHVPVSTVLDVSREPGTLERYGPISAEHARLLRPRSWRRVMVDADSGRPIAVDDRPTPVDPDPHAVREQVVAMLRPDVVVDVDEPAHDPSARLARLVDVRDVRCCGPGCSSTSTHRDHLVPHPLGPTSARNLGRVSPRCHRAKHAGWRLERSPDGSVTWTSPLGRTYDRPSPHAAPPHVDLHDDLPPLRPPPTGEPPPTEDSPVDLVEQEATHAADGAAQRPALDADDDAPPS